MRERKNNLPNELSFVVYWSQKEIKSKGTKKNKHKATQRKVIFYAILLPNFRKRQFFQFIVYVWQCDIYNCMSLNVSYKAHQLPVLFLFVSSKFGTIFFPFHRTNMTVLHFDDYTDAHTHTTPHRSHLVRKIWWRKKRKIQNWMTQWCVNGLSSQTKTFRF